MKALAITQGTCSARSIEHLDDVAFIKKTVHLQQFSVVSDKDLDELVAGEGSSCAHSWLWVIKPKNPDYFLKIPHSTKSLARD